MKDYSQRMAEKLEALLQKAESGEAIRILSL